MHTLLLILQRLKKLRYWYKPNGQKKESSRLNKKINFMQSAKLIWSIATAIVPIVFKIIEESEGAVKIDK
ncbi:hypothetical protein [Gaetbulibacter sp. PBL-D1]|uniref:hypothetical protein n=1 Tax=Gaetbulibacter sp. PBL-D1 TaxID=3422594 RepID=UPI003D2EBCD7